MTIVAAYRFDDRAIFVSDFRMTDRTGQSDTSLKFIDLDGRLGLFLSGSVKLWSIAIEKVKPRMSEITIDNIFDEDAPLVDELTYVAWGNPKLSTSRAIGFIIDDMNKKNVMFKIELKSGERAHITPLLENTCDVIGSGAYIPNIKSRISSRVQKAVANSGIDLFQLAIEMRSEIQLLLKESGVTSFRKLGISPYMCLSSIAGSHFLIRGEEIQGGTFSDQQAPTDHLYQFIKDCNGNLVLQNLNTNTTLSVRTLNDVQGIDEREIFDPEGMSGDSDLIDQYPDADHIYIFHQWVITSGKEEEMHVDVYRSIKKIDFVDIGNGIRLCKSNEPIINVLEEVPIIELQNYEDCRDVFIDSLLNSDAEFQAELSPERLFDHSWLSQYMPNYDQFYTKNIFE